LDMLQTPSKQAVWVVGVGVEGVKLLETARYVVKRERLLV
jgi:hypothetical protein